MKVTLNEFTNHKKKPTLYSTQVVGSRQSDVPHSWQNTMNKINNQKNKPTFYSSGWKLTQTPIGFIAETVKKNQQSQKKTYILFNTSNWEVKRHLTYNLHRKWNHQSHKETNIILFTANHSNTYNLHCKTPWIKSPITKNQYYTQSKWLEANRDTYMLQ